MVASEKPLANPHRLALADHCSAVSVLWFPKSQSNNVVLNYKAHFPVESQFQLNGFYVCVRICTYLHM